MNRLRTSRLSLGLHVSSQKGLLEGLSWSHMALAERRGWWGAWSGVREDSLGLFLPCVPPLCVTLSKFPTLSGLWFVGKVEFL